MMQDLSHDAEKISELSHLGHHEAAHQTAHAAAHGAHHGGHEAHELPNLISLLHDRFPDSALVQFLGQWENVFFSLAAGLLISFAPV